MQVLLIPDSTIQSTTITCYFLTGARDDPEDAKGATYLYQSLMYQTIENWDSDTHFSFVNRVGGFISRPKVSYDYSVFSQTVPANNEIEYALLLDSERLKSLHLTPDVIERAKETEFRTRSFSMNASNNVRAVIWVMGQLLAGTPYETPLSGDVDKLRTLNVDKVRETYSHFRDPASLIIVVAGKFDNNEIKNKISKFFLTLPPIANKKTTNTQLKGEKKGYIYKNWPDVATNENFVIYGFRAPALSSPDFIYFECLQYYLSDPRISYFNEGLNQVNHLNIAIQSQLTDYFDANACVFYFAAPNRLALEKSKYFINAELQALENRLISLGKLRTVKTLMELDYAKATATPDGKAFMTAQYFHIFGDPNYASVYLQRLRKITSYDIMRIVKKYIVKENRVVLNACK